MLKTSAFLGFSIEDMIRMLNAGLTVETLLDIIERSLEPPSPELPPLAGSCSSALCGMFLRALVELSCPDGAFVSFIDQHSCPGNEKRRRSCWGTVAASLPLADCVFCVCSVS